MATTFSEGATTKISYNFHLSEWRLVASLSADQKEDGINKEGEIPGYANLYDVISWRIIADFQTLNYRESPKMQGIWLKFCKALVTRYALHSCQRRSFFFSKCTCIEF